MGTMSHRERVLTALDHKEPDRVPIDLGATWVSTIAESTHESLKEYLGLKGGATESAMFVLQTVRVDERILKMFDTDIRPVVPGAPLNWERKVLDKDGYYYFEDDWGIGWRMPKKGGYYYDMVKHPLAGADLMGIKNYGGPEIKDPGRTAGLAERTKKMREETDYAIFPEIGGPGMFEGAWFLRGMEQFMVDMISDPETAAALMDKLLEISVGFYGLYLDEIGEYIDIVPMGDDLGGQQGPLMSPDIYRRLIKPRQKELVSFIKSKTKAKVFFHLCGDATPFLDDLVEIGVDILNPVQVTAANMDTKKLKERWGDRLVFWGGGCDTQRVLPFGTAREVEDEVRRRIDDLAPGGGFVFNQVHDIQPNTPPGNIVAMLKTAVDYGGYPIG